MFSRRLLPWGLSLGTKANLPEASEATPGRPELLRIPLPSLSSVRPSSLRRSSCHPASDHGGKCRIEIVKSSLDTQ